MSWTQEITASPYASVNNTNKRITVLLGLYTFSANLFDRRSIRVIRKHLWDSIQCVGLDSVFPKDRNGSSARQALGRSQPVSRQLVRIIVINNNAIIHSVMFSSRVDWLFSGYRKISRKSHRMKKKLFPLKWNRGFLMKLLQLTGSLCSWVRELFPVTSLYRLRHGSLITEQTFWV